jgi:hypothetical protein
LGEDGVVWAGHDLPKQPQFPSEMRKFLC